MKNVVYWYNTGENYDCLKCFDQSCEQCSSEEETFAEEYIEEGFELGAVTQQQIVRK